MSTSSKPCVPTYAVDLLLAAKAVINPPVGATPGALIGYHRALADAVAAFEAAMPLVSGVIRETSQ